LFSLQIGVMQAQLNLLAENVLGGKAWCTLFTWCMQGKCDCHMALDPFLLCITRPTFVLLLQATSPFHFMLHFLFHLANH